MRRLITAFVVQSLLVSHASAQSALPATGLDPLALPGVVNGQSLTDLQKLAQLRAMQGYGRRGVQTGMAVPPIINGYGPPTTPTPTASTGGKKSSAEKKAERKRREEQKRAARKAAKEAAKAARTASKKSHSPK